MVGGLSLLHLAAPSGTWIDNAVVDGDEGMLALFGQLSAQLEHYACMYTSRVSNFLFVSPNRYFRAPHGEMPHWFW